MKDKKRIIIFITVIVFLFIGLFFFARPGQNGNKEVSANSGATSSAFPLQAPETLYDFGTISMKNGNVNKMFKVANETNGDVYLLSLSTTCMCTTAYFVKPDGGKKGPFGMSGMGFVPKLNETIKAGESGNIEVVYDPNAHGPAGVGMIDRFIYLEDYNGKKLQFEIKANVTP